MLLRYCHFLLLLLLLLLEKYNIAIVLRMCLTQAMNYFCSYTRMCCYYLGGGKEGDPGVAATLGRSVSHLVVEPCNVETLAHIC